MSDQKWLDTSGLEETPGIRDRCRASVLSEGLSQRFPGEKIEIIGISVNDTGAYENPVYGSAVRLEGLPDYCEIQLIHYGSDCHPEKIIIWVPLAWNGRFMGTGGGGIQTGGIDHIRMDDRGMTVANAVVNGFASATTDAGNPANDWALIPGSKELDAVALQNWHCLGTHWMTLLGKACTEILHGRSVSFAYFHGGSGGGRQAMVEAQCYPEDYNGIWASFPAINWAHFVQCELWPIAVMNEHKNILPPDKLNAFRDALHDHAGGSDRYYRTAMPVSFNPDTIIGKETLSGVITESDALVMKEIWAGPVDTSGNTLWHFFRPGCTFWSDNLQSPAALYYVRTGENLGIYHPLFSEYFATWVLREPGQSLSFIDKTDYIQIHEKSVATLGDFDASDPDLRPFYHAGGKLILDHGLEDFIIPPDGSIAYYDRVSEVVGAEHIRDFFRMFLIPGFGHGDARKGFAPTEESGITALMNWVEYGICPESLQGVRVDENGSVIETGFVKVLERE